MQKVNLVGALERGIDAMKPEHEWDESKIHVSDLSVVLPPSDRKCHRGLWYRYHGYEKQERNAGTKLMFLQGDRLHRMATELLEKGLKNWFIEGIEEKVELNNITGRYDCCLSNPTENEYMIIDFKTVRGNAFNYLNEPKASHKLQVQTYMYATGIDNGAVIYIDREGQNFARQFYVEPDFIQVQKGIDTAKAIIEKTEPPAKMSPKIKINNNKGDDSIVVKEPWQCSYCDLKNVSCEGAIPADYESKLGKVCGHINQQGFTPLDEVEGIEQYVEPVLRQKEVI